MASVGEFPGRRPQLTKNHTKACLTFLTPTRLSTYSVDWWDKMLNLLEGVHPVTSGVNLTQHFIKKTNVPTLERGRGLLCHVRTWIYHNRWNHECPAIRLWLCVHTGNWDTQQHTEAWSFHSFQPVPYITELRHRHVCQKWWDACLHAHINFNGFNGCVFMGVFDRSSSRASARSGAHAGCRWCVVLHKPAVNQRKADQWMK